MFNIGGIPVRQIFRIMHPSCVLVFQDQGPSRPSVCEPVIPVNSEGSLHGEVSGRTAPSSPSEQLISLAIKIGFLRASKKRGNQKLLKVSFRMCLQDTFKRNDHHRVGSVTFSGSHPVTSKTPTTKKYQKMRNKTTPPKYTCICASKCLRSNSLDAIYFLKKGTCHESERNGGDGNGPMVSLSSCDESTISAQRGLGTTAGTAINRGHRANGVSYDSYGS